MGGLSCLGYNKTAGADIFRTGSFCFLASVPGMGLVLVYTSQIAL